MERFRKINLIVYENIKLCETKLPFAVCLLPLYTIPVPQLRVGAKGILEKLTVIISATLKPLYHIFFHK